MPKTRFSFQIKILLPVVGLLIAIVAIATWLITHRFMGQMYQQAGQTLATAEAVFQNSLEIRERNLLLRYQNLVNEPRFKAVAQLNEEKTMTVLLNELLEEMHGDAEAILFHTQDGTFLSGAKRDHSLSLQEFEKSSSNAITEALNGRSTTETIIVGDHLFNVVTAPVLVGNVLTGVLTIGIRIDESAAKEFRALTHSEIVFIANDHVVASTLKDPAIYPELYAILDRSTIDPQKSVADRMQDLTTSKGEHFLCLGGYLRDIARNQKAGYLLLSSYQNQLDVMNNTRRALWILSLSGIFIGSIIIAMVTRTITSPLRQLRDSAEAVGRGDFSRRVEISSNDECGELAEVFNGMTEKLTASRAQAEEALQTVKNTQVQLIQSEKLSAIGEFVAGIAHELNNPLTGVIGFSEMLHDSEISERQRKFVSRIMESADRCHRIVQNLLSFARQHPPERNWTPINKLIESTVEIVNYEMRTSNIQVIMRLAANLPNVLVDPYQIQQVFLNIINNARQAIQDHQERGIIQIQSELIDGHIRISFQDNGPGISAEYLSKIFDPFYTTKPVGIGTGLGLSLSYGIIREHGGTISAHSTPGKGATFVVDLPLSTADAAAQPSDDGKREQVTGGNGRKILVIDDEDSILELLQEALTNHGYHVNTARDGHTALLQFQADKYDVVICDWKIPGLTGQQIFEKLKEWEPALNQRFIFMSGDFLNPKGKQFVAQQHTQFLIKPFSVEELLGAIQKVKS